MGIYSNNSVFGVQISNVNDEGDVNIIFELKCDTIMSDEQKRDVKEYYEDLYNKQNIIFSVYADSIYGKRVFKQWFPISTKQFIDIFCNID